MPERLAFQIRKTATQMSETYTTTVIVREDRPTYLGMFPAPKAYTPCEGSITQIKKRSKRSIVVERDKPIFPRAIVSVKSNCRLYEQYNIKKSEFRKAA